MPPPTHEVMFRRSKHGVNVFALFPEEPHDERGILTVCFHDNRFFGILHSEAMTKSVAATDAEAAPLQHALECQWHLSLHVIPTARQGYVQRRIANAASATAFLSATDPDK